MKSFLITYDRRRGTLRDFRDVTDNPEARAERLALELKALRDGEDLEIVILQAESAEALHRTHARYFYSLRDLASIPRFGT